MSRPPIHLVDAFAAAPFQGNPATICLLDTPETSTWMQQVAMEMNQSETAFVSPEDDHFRIRWFTPTSEVELCGHATLAAAHVLWETGRMSPDVSIQFESAGGALFAEQAEGWIKLDFPKDTPRPWPMPVLLPEALGAGPRSTLTTSHDLLALFETEQQILDLAPDMNRLSELPFRGIIATAAGQTEGVDFVSRFFAPRFGIPEDPVTGSTHCALTPYWADQLGKDHMVARQLSRRGGELRVRVAGARVILQGQAHTTLDGKLRVP